MLPKRTNYYLLKILLGIFVFKNICHAQPLSDEAFDDILSEQPSHTLSPEISPKAGCSDQDFNDLFSPLQIVEILTSPPIQLQKILQLNLYGRTNPPITRALHDLPSLILDLFHQSCSARCWSLLVQPFFNQTRKMYFTQNSSALSSYTTLLTQKEFLEIIDEFEFSKINIPRVLSLFGTISLEERRLGALFALWNHHKRWTFSGALPIYYLEHNFFLNQQAQRQLNNSAFATDAGTVLPGINPDTFVNQHFINDRVGLGDLRIQIYYNIAPCDSSSNIDLGAQVTFPTARTIRDGIIGGTFCKTRPRPTIDFTQMFRLFCGATVAQDRTSALQLTELMVNYGIAAINTLTANVADSPLGEQHYNLGPLFHIKKHIAGCIGFESYNELKYTIPGSEIRYFIVKKNSADFMRDYSSAADAVANLTFLSEQASNTLYPTAVCITTRPGLIFKTTTALTILWHEKSQLSIGYDFWLQNREQLGSVHKRYTPGGPLNFAIGTKFAAHEGKIFGNLSTLLCSTSRDIYIALRGDTTVQNKGIGRSFTISVAFGLDF